MQHEVIEGAFAHTNGDGTDPIDLEALSHRLAEACALLDLTRGAIVAREPSAFADVIECLDGIRTLLRHVEGEVDALV